jgi:hypothetical protein
MVFCPNIQLLLDIIMKFILIEIGKDAYKFACLVPKSFVLAKKVKFYFIILLVP